MPKGTTNNPKGRPKGTPNKVTGQLRESIADFIEGNFAEVVKTWQQMEPRDKLTFYRDLIQFVIPKMQSADITSHNEMTAEEATDLMNKYHNQIANNIEEYYKAGRIEDYIARMRAKQTPPQNFNR